MQEPPSEASYAYAAASDARRDALAALELERDNRKRIVALERRQAALEAIVGDNVTAQIDATLTKEDAARIKLIEERVHPSMIGGVEIPEGWEPTIEGSNLVFRKKQ